VQYERKYQHMTTLLNSLKEVFGINILVEIMLIIVDIITILFIMCEKKRSAKQAKDMESLKNLANH
jgi:hypothetical protein